MQIAEKLLGRVWNRVYDGVKINHAGTLKDVSEGNEVVYVPCHRSHMDYLLMSYIIYHQGYALPHIAAGINLNIPVVGRFLRKGGAFFIRRSFGGNALYTVVFMKYLAAIMARGHSIEYFIEGGRSRTGRLLHPKTGMLSMTVRSFLRDPVRPGGVRAGVLRLRAHRRGQHLHLRAVGRAQEEGELARPAALAARAARALRYGARERGRAHPAQRHARRATARAGANRNSTTTRARRRSTRSSATWR